MVLFEVFAMVFIEVLFHRMYRAMGMVGWLG